MLDWVSTGHHPERFPKPFSSRVFRPIGTVISKAFNLGDGFEVYAVKNSEYNPVDVGVPGGTR